MGYETERSVIETYLHDHWQSLYPDMPIGYDGHDFTVPQDKTSIRVSISTGGAEQISLGPTGSNLIRHVGLIMVQIFGVGSNRSKSVRQVADDVSALFMNKDLSSSIRTRVPYIVGSMLEPPFMVMTVGIPYERDEFNG
jgi:hypothetical protein